MSGGGNFQGNQGAGGWSPPVGMPGSSDMGSSSWGGNYGNQTGQRQPGFVLGGPDDPANGGSGYMGGGGVDPGYNWAGPGGGNTIWPGWGQPWQPPVQNPGMPNYGFPEGNQPWQPPVQNPGMPNYGYPGGGGNTIWEGWGGDALELDDPRVNVQNPGMPGMGKYPKEGIGTGATGDVAAPNPWAGISQGRLGQARRFANAGQFGRAKQQIVLGGGNWGDVGGLLRTEAAADENYGGDWNWGGVSAGRLAEAKKMAASGKMGRAKQQFELGGGKWSPQIDHQMRAWQKGNK
jgi:hypothetical protein